MVVVSQPYLLKVRASQNLDYTRRSNGNSVSQARGLSTHTHTERYHVNIVYTDINTH